MSKGYLTRQETMHLCKAIGQQIGETVNAGIEPLHLVTIRQAQQIATLQRDLAALKDQINGTKASGRVIRLAASGTTARH